MMIVLSWFIHYLINSLSCVFVKFLTILERLWIVQPYKDLHCVCQIRFVVFDIKYCIMRFGSGIYWMGNVVVLVYLLQPLKRCNGGGIVDVYDNINSILMASTDKWIISNHFKNDPCTAFNRGPFIPNTQKNRNFYFWTTMNRLQ